MDLRGNILPRRLRLAAGLLAAGAACAGGVPAARAADPPVAPYGQVAAVGGLDTGAAYLPGSTTGLTPGEFVDPVGMAVSADPSAPGGEDIYVLDLVNPQEMNGLIAGAGDQDALALTYRLQRIAIAPSSAGGSDTGTETVLACTTFTLQSSAAAPDQRAVSLAVDGAQGHVDVLIDEEPDFQGAAGGYSIAEQVDQWPTTLAVGGGGTCPETASPTVAVPSATLVRSHDAGLQGDIDGDSIAFAGTGSGAQLALGGSEYLSAPLTSGVSRTQPFIELLDASGAVSGKPWKGSETAANALARSGPISGRQSAPGWGVDQSSILRNGSNTGDYGDALYALSANPDGSLNVTMGPQEYLLAGNTYGATSGADYEPIMATVSADLSTTSPVLPSPQASPTYNYPSGWTIDSNTPAAGAANSEIGATTAAEQDPADAGYVTGSQYAPAGGTDEGGTLAPSVVALGAGPAFPGGLYAGVVADDAGLTDTNLAADGGPLPGAPAWSLPTSALPGFVANLGVRVFTGCGSAGGGCASGDPLALIGNASTGPCSLRSGAFGSGSLASTIALATGPDGTIYALAQPDLDTVAGGAISPARPASGTNVGDILLEFKPGAGNGTSPGIACPQPSGSFAVTDVSALNGTPDTGTGPVTVLAGASIQLDASPLDLQGGVPWTYDWQTATSGPDAQSASATFTPDAGNPVYDRPVATQTFVYSTPGQDTATLQMQSDFGTTTVTRPIDVVAPGPITAELPGAGGAVAGEPATLSAAGTSVAAPDSIVDYHWDFGNGTSDDTAGPTELWTFPSAGTYTVTLSAIDEIGRVQTATEQVNVAPAPAAAAPPGAAPAAPRTRGRTARRFSVSPKLRAIRGNRALSVRVSCPPGDGTCGGTIAALTAGRVTVPGRRGRHVIGLGRGTFSVTAGHHRTIVIRLAKVTGTLITAQQALKLTVLVVAHDSAHARAAQRLGLYLFPPRTSRPRRFG